MQPSDEALAAAYQQQGDQEAFRLLIERHQERIFGYLMGMVRDRELANDLFQETFLRVIRALRNERGSYETQGRWLAWVLRIARNTALDHLRRRRRWTNASDYGSEGEPFWERIPDGELPADEQVVRRERAELLDSCIQELPSEQREVVLLRHDAELTFREIAELTGVSINTALGRMRYALINLRKMMAVLQNGRAKHVSPKERLIDG